MLSISAALDEKDILFSISDLAREFGVTTRAIRFYEDEGLLSPGRSGRQRVYTSRDHVRLKLIVRGKRLGFSLSEVREIIEMYDLDSGENGQLRYFLIGLSQRAEPTAQQGGFGLFFFLWVAEALQ